MATGRRIASPTTGRLLTMLEKLEKLERVK
jgi:hypothetical protein